ncbi:MAG: ABC transporter ATP-binding protein [Anaerolineales bacterium]
MPYLEMKGITKRFPGVVANNKIDFSVEKSSIHALLGENGAGKSTLMHVLYGIYKPDTGRIFMKGEEVDIPDPQVAIDLGIGLVHQEFQLVPSLTVAENVSLGHEPQNGIWVARHEMEQHVRQLAEQIGVSIDPSAKMVELSVGQKQTVEVLKLLYREAELLILDEPTTVLTPQETKGLFEVLKKLKEEGHPIIFITHKLREVMEICEKATVLRGGEVVEVVDVCETSQEELAHLMVGREMITSSFEHGQPKGEPKLTISGVRALSDRNLPALNGVNFEVAAGEVVGVAGVQGNGQTELIETLAGLRPYEGEIKIEGQELSDILLRERREIGMAFIPENRKEQGLNLQASVANNLVAIDYYQRPYSHNGILNETAIKKKGQKIIKQFQIHARSENTQVATLSGGNQQKVIVGRELSINPEVLIAAYPTRGLDVSAARFVRNEMVLMRDEGVAVLLISADLDEIFQLSDRILVLYEGRIVGERIPEVTSYEDIGLLMAGVKDA